MRILIPALLFTGALSTPAFAYLDPGTGSIVLQAIMGSVAVAGAAVSVYWQRFRAFFGAGKPRKK